MQSFIPGTVILTHRPGLMSLLLHPFLHYSTLNTICCARVQPTRRSKLPPADCRVMLLCSSSYHLLTLLLPHLLLFLREPLISESMFGASKVSNISVPLSQSCTILPSSLSFFRWKLLSASSSPSSCCKSCLSADRLVVICW